MPSRTIPAVLACATLVAACALVVGATGPAASSAQEGVAPHPGPGDAGSAGTPRATEASRDLPPGPGPDAVPPVLVTRQLSEAHGLAVGDTIRLSGEPTGEARAYRVAGIYEPTPDPLLLTDPRHEVRLRLGDRDLPAWDTERETADTIQVALTDPARDDEVGRAIAERWPLAFAAPTEGPRDGTNPFVVLERFHWAIALVTVFGASAFLLALMVMRAEERREILGILRLVGVRRRRVLIEVLLEGTAIAAAGAVGGILLALATQDLANLYFQHRYDTPLVFLRVTPAVAAQCLAIALPLGLAASLIASWQLLRREVLDLMRG